MKWSGWLIAAACLTTASRAAAQSCEVYTAALGSVGADSSNTVLIDRTVIGVPTFAFYGYASIRRGDTTFAKVAEPALRKLNATRQPLPACMVADHGWHTVSDSTLFAIFTSDGGRWKTFHERYSNAKAFALISQPMIVGDTAIIYVGIASGDLAGQGVLLRFVRDATGHWIKNAEAQLWVS